MLVRKKQHLYVRGEALTNEEAKTTSYVDLENRIIRFYDTKNRNDHELPTCDAVKRVLEDRRDIVQEAETRKERLMWVFPAVPKEAKLVITLIANEAVIELQLIISPPSKGCCGENPWSRGLEYLQSDENLFHRIF